MRSAMISRSALFLRSIESSCSRSSIRLFSYGRVLNGQERAAAEKEKAEKEKAEKSNSSIHFIHLLNMADGMDGKDKRPQESSLRNLNEQEETSSHTADMD